MEWSAGTRLGPYEIVGSLGAGGMGEVYRARDSKLDRQVAIKVLPQLFAGDPERRGRFDHEARTLASLNHQNIAQIYGAEEADGATAIVMELVEGEDLAARIARGRLTWPEAQPIARQIADALDAAHERGIIHRDLKPANIRITPDETVKVLDFGLAKAMSGNHMLVQDPALSPTVTSPSTRLGTILGTAAYMAPEQAKAKAVDKRADIWAFGCVLFEMLTGRSPFASDTAVESLGLVVTKEPDWGGLPPSVPPRIAELLRRCLMKDPRQRLRDIGDASFLLGQPENATMERAVERVRGGRRSLLAMVALALAVAAAAAVGWSLKPSPPVPLRRLELPEVIATSSSVAISPDGTQVAYLSRGRLYVRALDETAPRDIAQAPPTSEFVFWSPDSRSLGFVAQGTIRTVPAAGGPVFTVCRIPASGLLNGIVWRPDGSIVFAAWRDSLYSVAASGGAPEVSLQVNAETEVDFHELSMAPGGRMLIGVHLRAENLVRTELVELSREGRRTVLTEDSATRDFRYVRPDVLLFRRVDTNQGLWSLPFSDEPLDLARAAIVAPGATDFSASEDGTLVVRAEAPPTSTLAWVARDGSTTAARGAPIAELFPWVAISPDGGRVAFVAGRSGRAGLFVRDLGTGADTRLTTDESGQNASLGTVFTLMYPTWLPAGDRVLYVSGPVESSQLLVQRADGAGEPSPLGTGSLGRVSADGKWFLWLEDNRGQRRLRYASIEGDGTRGEARNPFPGSEKADIGSFDLSPDGRLLVYTIREADQLSNIHLTEFPGGGARWQVTTNGGTSPRFSRDGRELFFRTGGRSAAGAPEGRMLVMPLTLSPTVKLGVAATLLSGADTPEGYDVARDGRLLVPRRVQSGPEPTAVLVQNWPALVKLR